MRSVSRHRQALCVACLLWLLPTALSPTRAEVSEAWVHRYDGPAHKSDSIWAVAVDPSGSVLVAGYSDNQSNTTEDYIAKYAASDGALIWERRYERPANPTEAGRAMAVDGFGNVVIMAGLTTKYAAKDGTLLWTQSGGRALAVDDDGNVIIARYSRGEELETFLSTAKYAAVDGTLVWEKRSTAQVNYKGTEQAVAVDRHGDVILSATAWDGGYFCYTAKYAAADGSLLWERSGAFQSFLTGQMGLDGSGNVVVAGFTWNSRSTDAYTAKYRAADGSVLWEKRHDGPANGDDVTFGIAVDSIGNVIVAGVEDARFQEEIPGRGFCCGTYYLAKYAAEDGEMLWKNPFTRDAAQLDFPSALAVDPEGMIIVTGSITIGGNKDVYTAKYASRDGSRLWERRYNGPAQGSDSATCLAVGPNGLTVVGGYSDSVPGPGIDWDATAIAYRDLPAASGIEVGTTGVLLRFAGTPGQVYDILRAPTLLGPWTRLTSAIASAAGIVEAEDASPTQDAGFYRIAGQ